MRPTSNIGLSAIAFAATLFLTACGGGSSSNNPNAVVYNTDFTQPTIADNYSGSWHGDGGGFGGDAGGVADSAGGAGDGEFVQLTGGLPNGTTTTSTVLTWKILRSQYGLTGASATGTLTVQRSTDGKGGYVVTAVNGSPPGASQSNIFISTTGIVTGTLPLNLGGTVRDTAFTALRLLDSAPAPSTAATDFSAMAGTYAYGYFNAEVGTRANPYADGGWLRFNANGTGRMCNGAPNYSATCTNGLDLVVAYEGSSKSILRVTQAPTQSQPIAAGVMDHINALVIAKPVAIGGVTGYALSADVLSWDSRDTTKPARTGVSYAGRAYDASATPGNVVRLVASDMFGAYNLTVNKVDPTQSGFQFASIASTTGGVVKGRSSAGNTLADRFTCGTTQLVFPGTSTDGVFMANVEGSTNGAAAYFIYTDVDSFVFVPNDNSALGVLRRISSNPLSTPLANCQPA